MFGIDEGVLLLCGAIWLSGFSTAAEAMAVLVENERRQVKERKDNAVGVKCYWGRSGPMTSFLG